MKQEFKASRFLFAFLKEHWALSLLLLFAILGASLSGLLPPFALRYIIDSEITPSLTNPESANAGRIALLGLLYYGAFLLVGLFGIFESYMIDVFGQKLIHELRYKMMEKSHRLKVAYFTHHGSGEMASRLTDDVYAIELLFSDGLVSLIVSLVKIIGIIVSIFVLNYYLGFSLFLIIPLIALITHFFRKSMLKAQIANREVLNEESNHLSESIDNFRLLKNLGKEKQREEAFVHILKKGYQSQDKTAIFDSIYSPIIEVLKSLVIGFLAFLAAYSYTSTNVTLGISIGTFAAAMNLLSSLFSPIQDLGMELQSMQEGVSGIVRVENFLNEDEIVSQDESYKAEAILKDEKSSLLSFEHLSFHYEDGEEAIFDDCSLTIASEERVCLIGRTGAGKTTLFRLILGLLSPTGGRITLNGYDVSKIPDHEKRAIYGYVEQGFKPVKGTLKDQITLGDGSVSLDQVKQALKDSLLLDYIETHLPQAYDAPFNSEDFSRGQLQLLGLARAIVHNPKVLLLDEISANLDSKTEKDLIDALTLASQKRTVISISHRLSDQLGFEHVYEIGKGQALKKR
jgi:ATP-binding cassette subfamily B protein